MYENLNDIVVIGLLNVCWIVISHCTYKIGYQNGKSERNDNK